MYFIINIVHYLVSCTCVGQKHRLLLDTFCPKHSFLSKHSKLDREIFRSCNSNGRQSLSAVDIDDVYKQIHSKTFVGR